MMINASSIHTSSSNINANNYTTETDDIMRAERVDKTVEDFKEVIGEEDFDKLLDNVKDTTSNLKFTRFEFSVHDETKRVIVKIFDRVSDELITEIPPEKMLDLLAGIWKQAGLIVDEKV